MTKRSYLEDMSAMLTGTKHDRFARSVNLNVAATAFVLGVDKDQVKRIMQGYPRVQVGNSILYAKEDVYQAIKEKGVLTA
jgi:hypothetical protein